MNHIPCVTDEQLKLVTAAAASPVFIEWFGPGSFWPTQRRVLERLSKEFEMNVIFLRCCIAENPEAASDVEMGTCGIQIYKRGSVVYQDDDYPDEESYRQALKMAVKDV